MQPSEEPRSPVQDAIRAAIAEARAERERLERAQLHEEEPTAPKEKIDTQKTAR